MRDVHLPQIFIELVVALRVPVFFFVTEPGRSVDPCAAFATAFAALEIVTSAGGDTFLETLCRLFVGINLLWVLLANIEGDLLGL